MHCMSEKAKKKNMLERFQVCMYMKEIGRRQIRHENQDKCSNIFHNCNLFAKDLIY